MIIVQEFCVGGDLLKIMYKCGGRLFERQAVNLVLQPFLTSLQYLHTQVRGLAWEYGMGARRDTARLHACMAAGIWWGV